MIRSFEALVERLGTPAIDLDGALIHGTLRQPMVYVWLRTDGEREFIQYVGKSLEGVARPLSGYHHRRDDLGYVGDRLLCWCVESEQAAAELEQELILLCNPRLNGRFPRRNGSGLGQQPRKPARTLKTS